jgi:hypothetical protein
VKFPLRRADFCDQEVPAASCSCVIIAIGFATVPKQLRGFGRPNGDRPLQASDVGKQDRFFLGQMLGELFIQLHESVAAITGNSGLRGAVTIHNLLEPAGPAAAVHLFTYAWCLATMCELKLSRDVLSAQFSTSTCGFFSASSSAAITESISRFPAAACLCQRLAAPATVVDSKLLKDTYCRRLFQCDFADGLCGCGHFDLLEFQLTDESQ